MKKALLMITLCFGLCVLSACGSGKDISAPQGNTGTPITVIVPKSAAAIPVFRMLNSNALGENVLLDVKVFDSTEAMIAWASGMDYSFMILPVHTAAVLYNNDLNVKLVNVFSWGGMKLVTTDVKCRSWEDLAGKELYVLSKGSVPDILTRFFLTEHSLKIGETIDLVYSTYPEISQLMGLGRIQYAVDGEPYATSNAENIGNYQIIADYTQEWKSAVGDGNALPAYGLAASGSFVSGNGELAQQFAEAFSTTVEWMVNNPEDAGTLAGQQLNVDSSLIANAMPNFNFHCVSAAASKEAVEKYFEILFGYRPESIGGIIPDAGFYFKN